MIVYGRDGQEVFRSVDLDYRTPAGRIRDGVANRTDEQGVPHRADVVAGPAAASVSTHPERDQALTGSHSPGPRRTVIQLARLTAQGEPLLIDRDTVAFRPLPQP
ncbi:glycoside hydrolase family protein [Streptomyces canus]|uniref:hypothetical protein n=1 Tax=Streptomyces canus TaxID=58343 RepID=UPI00074AB88C|nr:hypothetical protein [Streptomyces canus]KUN04491.1 hypothetical protein AQI96_36350 [Streptomyces canus]